MTPISTKYHRSEILTVIYRYVHSTIDSMVVLLFNIIWSKYNYLISQRSATPLMTQCLGLMSLSKSIDPM